MSLQQSKKPKLDHRVCTSCLGNDFRRSDKWAGKWNDRCAPCLEKLVGQKIAPLRCVNCKLEKKRCDYAPDQWFSKAPQRGQCLTCHLEEYNIMGDLSPDDNAQYIRELAGIQCEEYWKKDKAAVLELHKHGIGLYDCEKVLKRIGRWGIPPANELVGTYDLIYVRFEAEGTSNEVRNVLQQRTTGGTLEIALDDVQPNDDQNTEPTLNGRLVVVDAYQWALHQACSGYSFALSEHSDILQGELRDVNVGYGSWIPADDLTNYEKVVELRMVGDKSELDWIPCEDVDGSSQYAKAMRMTVDKDRGKRGLLWLCQHKSMPESVSRLVREFMGVHEPNLHFRLEEDDLWLKIKLEYYSSSETLQFAARRRKP